MGLALRHHARKSERARAIAVPQKRPSVRSLLGFANARWLPLHATHAPKRKTEPDKERITEKRNMGEAMKLLAPKWARGREDGRVSKNQAFNLCRAASGCNAADRSSPILSDDHQA